MMLSKIKRFMHFVFYPVAGIEAGCSQQRYILLR